MGLALRRTVYAPFVMNALRWVQRSEADLLTSADDTAISSWADASGNSRALAQGTGTAQPVHKVAVLNGHNVVRFDGSDDRVSATIPSTAQPFLLVLVGALRSLTAGTAFQPISTQNTVAQVNTSDAHVLFGGASLTGPTATTNPFVLLARFNGATGSIQVNGTLAVGNVGTNASGTSFVVGATFAGANPAPLDAALAGMIAPLPPSRFIRRLSRELRCRFGVA